MSEISAGETNLNDFVGKSGRITRLEVPELMGIRLKAMGLFEGQYLELSRLGNPMIVKAAGGVGSDDGVAVLEASELSGKVIAMLGNPNVGKTSIFNRLTNLLAKTSNFPGTTIDRRIGRVLLSPETAITLVDLPGVYS